MVPSDLAFDRHRRLVPAIITGSAPLPMAGTGPAMTYEDTHGTASQGA